MIQKYLNALIKQIEERQRSVADAVIRGMPESQYREQVGVSRGLGMAKRDIEDMVEALQNQEDPLEEDD